MQPALAFVDEYGDPSLEVQKEGVTDYFVVAAVMVEPDEQEGLAASAEEIRARHFQTGEMKSSSVGTNWSRRVRLLNEVGQLEFTAHVLVIDKARILKESGLQYKRSFLKYIHRLLYDRLYRAIPDLVVIADEHGSRDFMDGFKAYVHSRSIPDLFESEADIHFENSKAQPLVQLADVIAGSFGHAATAQPDRIAEVVECLNGRVLTCATWPPTRLPVPAPRGRAEADVNALVRRHALNLANDFIVKNAGDDDESVKCQIETVRHLYFQCEFISDRAYVGTARLRKHLFETLGVDLTVHAFRSRVIGPLRDAGVLLASGAKGYKLPVTATDIESFISHGVSIIGPLLERLNKARDELRMVTNGRLDLFEAEERQFLKRLRNV